MPLPTVRIRPADFRVVSAVLQLAETGLPTLFPELSPQVLPALLSDRPELSGQGEGGSLGLE